MAMKLNTIALLPLTLALTACLSGGGGGGGGDSAAGKTGRLIDSAVAGVSYSTAQFSGTTNADGEYLYQDGETVTFRIGDIVFPAVTAKGVLTPRDLAGSTDINDPVVINIARLLQTLDEDGNPDNGIVIPELASTAALDFNLPVADFAAAVQAALGITLISQADALAHLQNELDELNGGTTDPGREAATVPAGLVGVYQFLFEEVTAGSGIRDGVIDEYQVTADGRLILPGGSELSNPVYISESHVEIAWHDSNTGLGYALSNANTGVINELNVSNGLFGDAGYEFYGSYVPYSPTTGDVPQALLDLAGSYDTQPYFSKAGNRHGWAVGDELTLAIDSVSGVIDIAGIYQLDPADSSFSWADKTGTNPRFNPHYEVLYESAGSSIKLLLYRQPGEELNGWRLQDDANAADGVNVASEVMPLIAAHQAYLDTLDALLPATLTVIAQDSTYNSGLDGAVCTQYAFDLDYGATNGKPRILFNQLGSPAKTAREYIASSAAYSEQGSGVSLYWSGFDLTVVGSTLTATVTKLGEPINEVLSNDTSAIAAVCP
jgi:hypothetical protein